MVSAKQVTFFSVVVLLVVLFICHPFGLYFLCDDFVQIPRSARGDVFQNHLLRPLVHLALWLDIKIWGLSPEGLHFTNLLLHVFSSVLVFFLSTAIFRTYKLEALDEKLPLLTAVLFLAYGFHAEPVFWLAAKVAVLTTVFLQLSLLFFLEKRRFSLPLSLLFFAAALFTYEASWITPIIVGLLAVYAKVILGDGRFLKRAGAYWLVFFGYLWFRFFYLNQQMGYGAEAALGGDYLPLFRNIAALITRLFTPPYENSAFYLVHCFVVAGILLYLLYRVFRRSQERFLFMTLLAMVVLLSAMPAMSLGIDTHDTESERFIYLPSVFACIFFTVLISSAFTRLKLVRLLLAVSVAANLVYLYKASGPYRYASQVSRFVVESLNTAPFAKTLTFTNLPSQYKGGLLFRVGFTRYGAGIIDADYHKATVLSYREILRPVTFTLAPVVLDTAKKDLFIDFTENQMFIRQ